MCYAELMSLAAIIDANVQARFPSIDLKTVLYSLLS